MTNREKQNTNKINKQSIEEINRTINTSNQHNQSDHSDFNKENSGLHQIKDDNNNQYEISEAKNKKLTQENIGEK